MKPYDFIQREPRLSRPDTSGDPLRPGLARACCEYNYALGHLVTPEVLALYDAIDEVRTFNTRRGFGAARLVAIDGPSHVGKTTSMLAIAEHQQREAMLNLAPGAVPPTTWLYHEATTEGRGRAMVAGLLDACGLPRGASEPAASLVSRLARFAPDMGLQGIIIDDVHFLVGSRQDGIRVSNVLKNLISSVPTTVVLIGLGLHQLPIITATQNGTSASDQLARRAQWVTFHPLPLRVGKDINPLWVDTIRHLHTALALPRGMTQFKLHQARCLACLVEGSGGWPGRAIEWATRATNHAIRHDAIVDIAALEATRPLKSVQ